MAWQVPPAPEHRNPKQIDFTGRNNGYGRVLDRYDMILPTTGRRREAAGASRPDGGQEAKEFRCWQVVWGMRGRTFSSFR
jgi:hypothetical protein